MKRKRKGYEERRRELQTHTYTNTLHTNLSIISVHILSNNAFRIRTYVPFHTNCHNTVYMYMYMYTCVQYIIPLTFLPVMI